MAADCCPEGARLQAVVVDAIDDVVLAGALLADSDAYIAAVNSYQAHLATHGGDDTPPSAPHGDGGGVVNPESAEGAGPMTPEEPCWLEVELGAHGDSPWFVPTGALCLLYGKIAAHIEDHNARCQSITPCPACRMRELEAEVVRWRSGAIRFGTPAPWHDPCDERIEALEAKLSAAAAALAEADEQGGLGSATVRFLLEMYATAADEELTGDGRALKASLLTVVREAGFVPVAEVMRLRSALFDISEYGHANHSRGVQSKLVDMADAALREAKAAATTSNRDVSELIGTPPKKPAWRPPPERECE